MRLALLGCLGLVLLAPAARAGKPKLDTRTQSAQRAVEADAVAAKALRALKAKDDVALARLAHPKKGVRFSTYGTVSKTDVRLWRAGLRGAFKSPKRWIWGSYDGSGEPMRLSFDGFRQFLWQCDYTQAAEVRHNPKSPPEGSGNQGGNLAEHYRKAELVQYYCPSDDTRMWSSLTFAFERERGRWVLVGVVHDGWTI